MLALDQIDKQSFRPLRRQDYLRLWEMGAFDGERVELLDGVVATMSPQQSRHASTVQRLNKLLTRSVGDRAEVRPQLPLIVSDISEPEPDLAVVAPGDYLDEHPRTAWLVVEVAYSSLVTDLRLKARLYAEAGVTEYWVVDLREGRVVVHRKPRDGAYESVRSVGRDERIGLVALPDVEVTVETFVPAPR